MSAKYTGGSVCLVGTIGWESLESVQRANVLNEGGFVFDQPKPYRAPDGSTWVSRGAYEQGLKLKEAVRRISELETELMLEKGKRFPDDNISGEFSEYEGRKSLAVWPAKEKTWPKRIAFMDGTCSFCGSNWHVLEVDSSSGEYDCLSICQACTNKVFDAFDKAVTG